MVQYQRNNIIFRIASADAISKFKKVQMLALMQLARRDINFNLSAREVVLLEYDRLSLWMMRIERICLAAKEGQMPEALATGIKESYHVEIREIEAIFDSYPDIFTKKIIDFVKIIHSYAKDIMHDRITVCLNQTVDRAFEQLVNIVSVYMQHLLICLHEINNNIEPKGEGPFISISEFCILLGNDDVRFKPILLRAKYFQSLGCGNTYLLKPYAELDLDIYNAAFRFFEQSGIFLTKEKTDSAYAYA